MQTKHLAHRLLEPEIRDFITKHQDADISDLGLKKPPAGDWPYPLILDQIKARQKAAKKIPAWISLKDDIIFAPADILEQASSTATARYKASLIKGKSFIDLTAGSGVDSLALSEHYDSGTCVEQSADLCALLIHNIPLLTNKLLKVIEARAEDFVLDMQQTDLVYIDPQRRNDKNKGLYRFESCSPNIIDLLKTLKIKTQHVLIKASPMLDIEAGVKALDHVSQIHIVEWQGECKEILFVLDFETNIEPADVPITSVILSDIDSVKTNFTYTRTQEQTSELALSEPLKYLYEPGPALQKSGASKSICSGFKLMKLHQNTQLYTGNVLLNDFPGRVFEILGHFNAKKSDLPSQKANLTVRNFPLNTVALRKKLKLEDGGDDYFFACTLRDGHKTILHCKKT